MSLARLSGPAASMQNDQDHMTCSRCCRWPEARRIRPSQQNAVILRKNLDTGQRDEVPVDLNKVMELKAA